MKERGDLAQGVGIVADQCMTAGWKDDSDQLAPDDFMHVSLESMSRNASASDDVDVAAPGHDIGSDHDHARPPATRT